MSRSVHYFLLFVFVYTTKGIPLGDNPERKETLSLKLIPSQWGKDSEISQHWPKGEVSYLFDDQSYDDGVKDRVRIAMAALERDSCIRFKEQKGNGDGSWLHFTNPGLQRECFHDPSYQSNGEIQVVLGYDCLRQRDIMHSVLHGVGFRDEVSHPQRDLYVKIMWGNIQSAYKPMFRIQTVNNAGGLVEYDPMSIMQFHDRAYSLNGQATITPLLPGLKIAPSDKLSHLDKMKLSIMFGHECNKRKVGEVLNKCKGILTQYDETDLATTKPDDNNSANNEDPNASGNNGDQKEKGTGLVETIIVGNDGNHDDPNASGNNEDQKKNDNELQETIVVGNDGNQDDPNQSGNNGDQKKNYDELEETIVVGNDGNTNNKGVPNGSDNNNGDEKGNPSQLEETIIVGNDVANSNTNNENYQNDNTVNENTNTIENINIGPNEEVIIVGNGDDNPDPNDDPETDTKNNNDNKDAKQISEVIIVGNEHKGGDVSNDNNADNKAGDEAIIVGNDVNK